MSHWVFYYNITFEIITKWNSILIMIKSNIIMCSDLVSFWIDRQQYFQAIGLDLHMNDYISGILYFNFMTQGS